MALDFSQLGLDNRIINAISELGYRTPTPVQEKVIPELLVTGNDMVCLAQTGTGKTAAFGLPILQKTDTATFITQSLVLAPTRELARQISQDLTNYGRNFQNLKIVPVYGGAGIDAQIRLLKKGAQIIVATPGRIIDLVERGAADLSSVKTLILDEADEMLNMGFKDELDTILESLPADRQTLLFSATLPKEVEKIARTYMKDPRIIQIGARNSGTKNVQHFYFTVHAKDRYSALKRLVDYNPDIYGIIFCRTRQETQEIADSLIKDGYDADSLHGELSQMQRDLVMKRFKEKSLKLLVATDVAARGIDVNNLSHVINYNLPDEIEQYTHRSGRTGRADKSGVSYAIINTKEKHKIKKIEKAAGITFTAARIPNGDEVCERQLAYLIEQIDNTPVSPEIDAFLPVVTEKWASLSKEDIIKKVLSIEFNRFIEYYRYSRELNIPDEKENSQQILKTEKGFSWIRLNIGSRHNITVRHIIRLMVSCGLGKKGIGKIELRKDQVFVSVAERAAGYLVQELNGSTYRGRKLKAEHVNNV